MQRRELGSTLGYIPGSIVPTPGASGAVAALMNAFLIRFPNVRIEMIWWAIVLFRFKAPADWLLPAWLFMEIFYGLVRPLRQSL